MTDVKWPDLRSGGEISTADETLNVLVDPADALPIGAHTFQLVVVDSTGNASKPAQVRILVRDTTAPTAVITPLDPSGRRLPDNVLEAGSGFLLSAKGSADLPPGKIEKYIWTLVPM